MEVDFESRRDWDENKADFGVNGRNA